MPAGAAISTRIRTSGLLTAIQTTDTDNSDASNTIELAPAQLHVERHTTNEIVIQNATATNKQPTTIAGGTEQNTVITGGSSWNDRIIEIIGGSILTVNLQSLTLTGGNAVDGGGVGGDAALGGGLLIDSGDVSLSNVAVENNRAVGASGAVSHDGYDAEGGGIYLASGALTLTNSAVSRNNALGRAAARAAHRRA